MRFKINIATRTHIDRRMVNRAGYAVLTLLSVILAWNVSHTFGSLGELRRLQSENRSYERQLNSRPSGVSEKQYTSLLADITYFNEVIERKSFDWLGLLGTLEGGVPDGIALSSMAPDRKTGELKIEGFARNFAGVRSFVEKLEDSKAYASVLLLSHTNILVGEKEKGVRFTISCKAALR